MANNSIVDGLVDDDPVRKPKSSLARRVVGDSAVDAASGLLGLGQSVLGLGDLVSGGRVGQAAEAAGFHPQEQLQFLNQQYSPERQASNQAVQDAQGSFVDTGKAMLTHPSTIAGTVLQSAPAMLAGGGVARGLTPLIDSAVVRSGIGEGLVQAGSSAEQTREANPDGRLSGRQAAAAVASGIGDAAIVAASGGVSRKLGIADVDTLLAGGKTAVGSAARGGALRKALEGVLSEGVLQELPQSAQEQVWQNYAQGRPLMEGVGAQAAQGALAGAVIGGPTAAFGGHGHAAPAEAAAPEHIQPDSSVPIDPQRGVLSRAVAAGVIEGHVPNAHVVGADFLAAPPPPVAAMPPALPATNQSAEVQQFQVQAQAQAADRGMPYVATGADGRALSIKPFPNLKPEARTLEAKAAQQVLADPDAAVAQYEALKDTDGGRIISTDEARELFPEYSSGPEGRTQNALAVHEPASFVAKEVWQRRLAEDVAPGRAPLVLFTAGGTGAGKTTAIARNPGAQAMHDIADLVYDGNLQSVSSAQEKITQAIDSGRKVAILYVHRDPVEAFANGALPRANREDYGRTVPIASHASTHIGAANTIQELSKLYEGSPDVSIHLLDNSGTETPIHDSIASVAAMQHTGLEENLHAAAQHAAQFGLTKRDGSIEPLAQRVADYYGVGQGAQPGQGSAVQPAGNDGADRAAGAGEPGQGQEQAQGEVGFLGSRAPAEKITATGKAPADSRAIHSYALKRDGREIGQTEAWKQEYGDGEAWHLGFVGLSPEHRGGNGASAIRAAANKVMKVDASPTHVTAEAMSQKSFKAMLRVFGAPEQISNDIHALTPEQALEQLPSDANEGLTGNKVFVAFKLPDNRKLADPGHNLQRAGQAATPSTQFGVIVAPKPGTKVTAADGEVRPYRRDVDGGNLPPAAAPVQRAPDLAALQTKAQAIFKRPAAATALRKLFGVKGVKLSTIRGSYEGVPELSFQLTATDLGPENANKLATFLGMAFSQDAVIVTKPDPVGPAEDAIPTLRLYNTDGTKLSDATFEAVTQELRGQGIDYSETADGREIRVLHFGDDAGLEALSVAMASAGSAHNLAVDNFFTRSDLHEAPDYRGHLGEGGNQVGAGQPSGVFRTLVDQFLVPYTRAIGAVGYRFDARRYADRFALNDDELKYLEQQLGTVAPRSTVPLLTGEEALPARGKGRPTNADAAWFMQNRAAELGAIKPGDRSAQAKEAIAETFAQEVEYQIGKPEGKSAVGWYDRQLTNAMATLAEAHPEIATDPNAAFVMKSLMAITSQGLTVEQNFNTALKSYLRYQATGKIDLTGVTLPGKAAPIAKKNVDKLGKLIADKGVAGAAAWMRAQHTIRELKAQGFKDVNGRLDEQVRGWHAFGPKIGSFGNNLDGDFDTLTADLWFSRTWNRALGTMFQYSATREANSIRDFRAELVKALNEPGYNQVVDGLPESDRGKIGDFESDFALAKRLYQAFAAGGYKDKTPLNRAAKAWVENVQGLQDVPRGDPERRWQDEVMREVQAKVEQRSGQRVAIADLQALLWYQEKELFRLLGAANKASAPLDYQDAAKAAIAQVEGQHLGHQAADATIVETAYPLGSDYLLAKLRRIAPDARITVVAGTDKAASRVAIDRALTEGEQARVARIGGIKRTMPGAYPTQLPPAQARSEPRLPPRFQVPAAVLQTYHYAALSEDQQGLVDASLAGLKRAGYPAAWLKGASYFFAHNNDQDFAARFYLNGETKGAVSLRQDRLANPQKIMRDMAHELAHAADFDHASGGFYSINSPLFALEINPDGSTKYTGDVIRELEINSRDSHSPLYDELQYPFKASDFNPSVMQVEAFAQGAMLYTTDRAALKKYAPSAYKLFQELFNNERQDASRSSERSALAVRATLRSASPGPLALRSEGQRAGVADRQVDRSEPDRPAADRGEPRPGGAGVTEGLDSRTPSTAESFDGYTIPSWRMGEHLSSEAGQRLEGYQAAAKVGTDKLRTFLQDYFLPVKRVQQAIAARGGQVHDASDVYGREEVYYGRTGEQLRQLEDDHVKPLVQAMVAANIKQADLELYLYAKFAPARNARIAEINPKFPDGGSGMTNADAAQVLADFERDGQTAKLEALAKRVHALNAVRLDTLEEGGLLSPGEADLWRAEPNYVPLKGFAEGIGKDEPVRMPTGQGFSIGGKEAHQALGRKSRAADLIANTIAQAEQAVIRAEKNRVATALLRLAEENPNPALWSVDQAPEKPQLSAAGEVSYKKDPRHVLADNVVAVKVNGEQHFITLHDARLAASMKNLGAAKTGAFLRGFSAVNRFLSLTRTMLAPEFVLANFSRDLQTAAINLTGDQSTAMAGRVIKDIPQAMRAMFGQLRGKSQGGEWARWAQEFANEGGMTSFVAQYTVEEQQAKINGLLKSAEGGAMADIRNLAKGALDLIEDVNGAVENGTRLSAYAAARRQGMSTQQAARLAKNLTTNFNRKGQAGPVINALYLFYNASIQGTARFLQAMKHPKVQKIMAATAVVGFGLAMGNRALGGKDDDGEDRWDKIPDWEKARNLIIFLPGGNGAMVKIPLPYTYNLPFLVGEGMESAINSRKSVASVAATLAENVLTAFNPIGDVDLHGDSAVAAAKLVSPTAVDPLVDVAVNRNFFGAPINPERNPFDKVPDPDSQSAFPSANPVARWIANALNTASGGDKLHPGAIDVSPGTLNYIFDYLTGGTGSFVSRTGGAVMLAAQGEPVPARMIPFARVFAGSLDDRRITDTFYQVRSDVNLKAEMAKTGLFDSPQEKRDALFGRRMAGQLKGTERQLASIRQQRKRAQAANNDALVKQLEARERQVQLRFNTSYFKTSDAMDVSE